MPAACLYVPHFNVMAADDVRPFVEAVATAQLVTVGEDGVPDATFLPVLWEGERLVGHLARANGHWRRIVEGSQALAIVTGPDAYVSPSWYAAKAEHGKVVPTWNYSVVHLRGTVVVSDAPDDYIDKNLRPIVGVEMVVSSVQAKAKLSQNRSDADRAGVAVGLAADGRDPSRLVAE